MSLINFLPLRREVRSHWAYKDNDYFKTWVEMLFCARFSEDSVTDVYNGQLYTINYGEFLFSRRTWADRLNTTEGKIRKFVELAIKDEMITKVGRIGKKGATIYRINNYKTYNYVTEEQPTQTPINKGIETNVHPPLTHQKPTANPPLTTKEEGNKEKTKDIDGFFEKIWKAYPLKKGKGKVSPSTKKKLFAHGDEMEKCIQRYVNYQKSNSSWLKLQNGSTFFNSGYIDYLDENYADNAPPERIQPRKAGKIKL